MSKYGDFAAKVAVGGMLVKAILYYTICVCYYQEPLGRVIAISNGIQAFLGILCVIILPIVSHFQHKMLVELRASNKQQMSLLSMLQIQRDQLSTHSESYRELDARFHNLVETINERTALERQQTEEQEGPLLPRLRRKLRFD